MIKENQAWDHGETYLLPSAPYEALFSTLERRMGRHRIQCRVAVEAIEYPEEYPDPDLPYPHPDLPYPPHPMTDLVKVVARERRRDCDCDCDCDRRRRRRRLGPQVPGSSSGCCCAKDEGEGEGVDTTSTTTTTTTTTYWAKRVIVTVSLGVLKAELISFRPPLPTPKRKAIDRLGFGNAIKVNEIYLYDDKYLLPLI